jgi:hypothetical protein
MELMAAAQKRLTEKLGNFFAERAQHVSRQIFERMARETIGKSSTEHSDLHVKPENAMAINLVQPVADVVTRANIQHLSWEMVWEMVRGGKTGTETTTVPLAAIIPTQQVVDKVRVAKHEGELQRGEEPTNPPLALLWQGDYFLIMGHHGLQAARNLGVRAVAIDVMTAPE